MRTGLRWAAPVIASAALWAASAEVRAVDLGKTTWNLSGTERIRFNGKPFKDNPSFGGTSDEPAIPVDFAADGGFVLHHPIADFTGTWRSRGRRGFTVEIAPEHKEFYSAYLVLAVAQTTQAVVDTRQFSLTITGTRTSDDRLTIRTHTLLRGPARLASGRQVKGKVETTAVFHGELVQ